MSKSDGSGHRPPDGALKPSKQMELPLRVTVASATVLPFRRATTGPAASQRDLDALRRILQYAEKLPQ